MRVDDLRGALLVGGAGGEGLEVLHRDGQGAHALRRDCAAGDVEADHEARRVDEDVEHGVRPQPVEERAGSAPVDDEDGRVARLVVGAGAPLDLQRRVEDVEDQIVRGARSVEPLRHGRGLRDGRQLADVASDRAEDLRERALELLAGAGVLGVPIRDDGAELRDHVHATAARGEQLWRDLVVPRARLGVLRVRRVVEEVGRRDDPLVVRKLAEGRRERRHGFRDGLDVFARDGLPCLAA